MSLQQTRAHYEQQARDAQGRFTAEPQFAELNRYWSDEDYRRFLDEERAADRREAFNEWSAAFDAGHPLGADRERELMRNAGVTEDEVSRVIAATPISELGRNV